jgi:hypothetical protein
MAVERPRHRARYEREAERDHPTRMIALTHRATKVQRADGQAYLRVAIRSSGSRATDRERCPRVMKAIHQHHQHRRTPHNNRALRGSP